MGTTNFDSIDYAGVGPAASALNAARSTAPTFVMMGDSRIASQYNDNTLRRNKNAGNFLNVANTQLGQRMQSVGNFAVAGQRSDQFMVPLSQALATKARFLVVFGVVNDLAQNVGAVAAWANIRQIIDAGISAGMIVITCTEPGATGFTAAQIAERNDFNARLYAYAAQKPGLLVLDYAGLVLDPTATSSITFRTQGGQSLSYDGTHLANSGARVVGTALAGLLAPMIPSRPVGQPIDGLSQSGTAMLLKNGLFLTTTGGSTAAGITGSVPANWGALRTGAATANVSTQASTNPDGIGNEFVIAATSTAANERIQLSQSVTTGVTFGDVMNAICEVGVDAGSSNMRSVRAYITTWTDGLTVSTQRFDMQPLNSGVSDNKNSLTTAYTDTLAPDPHTVQSGTSFDRVDFTIAVEFSAAGSATVRLRKAGMFKQLAL